MSIAECEKIWEPSTHMTKADWARACRRVERRLQEIDRKR